MSNVSLKDAQAHLGLMLFRLHENNQVGTFRVWAVEDHLMVEISDPSASALDDVRNNGFMGYKVTFQQK